MMPMMKAARMLLAVASVAAPALLQAGAPPPPPPPPASPALTGPSTHQEAVRTTDAVIPDAEDLQPVRPAPEEEKPGATQNTPGEQQ